MPKMKHEVIEGLHKGKGIDKFELTPEDMETNRSYALFGPNGVTCFKQAIILEMPKLWKGEKIGNHAITYINLTREEKEELFDILDAELHDTTYNQLDDMVSSLRAANEELQDSLDYYEEAAAEETTRKRVCGF